MTHIKEIPSFATYPVRGPVLRAGQPIESCAFDQDDAPATRHFGIYDDVILAGVITVLEQSTVLFGKKGQFQIRGMAVLDHYRGKNFGKALLSFAEDYIRKQHGRLIWFNARVAARGFYEKNGYQVQGDCFDIPDVGLHYVMFKLI